MLHKCKIELKKQKPHFKKNPQNSPKPVSLNQVNKTLVLWIELGFKKKKKRKKMFGFLSVSNLSAKKVVNCLDEEICVCLK